MAAPHIVSEHRSPSVSDSGWKRFQQESDPSTPVLMLDRDGTIQSATPAARAVLEHDPDDRIEECFFSHVHKRNMRRVMRDLADMVRRGKQRARWLLRLRTGNGRWRWYRCSVYNRLGTDEEHVLVRLQPL